MIGYTKPRAKSDDIGVSNMRTAHTKIVTNTKRGSHCTSMFLVRFLDKVKMKWNEMKGDSLLGPSKSCAKEPWESWDWKSDNGYMVK